MVTTETSPACQSFILLIFWTEHTNVILSFWMILVHKTTRNTGVSTEKQTSVRCDAIQNNPEHTTSEGIHV